ncbi:uncharacterized protein LOC134271604 [Saccostrea cucullata]|uniref:uncharacterized protein LOC134271604 n=1 Tax=Saccostrea cuccullata TaxID=36930 RepID=UPI002ECFBAFE
MPGIEKSTSEPKPTDDQDDPGVGETSGGQAADEEAGAVGGETENGQGGQRKYITIETDVTVEECLGDTSVEGVWFCSHCRSLFISVFAASFEVEELSVFLVDNVLYIEGNHTPRHGEITTPARTFTQTFIIPPVRPDHYDLSSVSSFTNGDYLCVCIPSHLDKHEH